MTDKQEKMILIGAGAILLLIGKETLPMSQSADTKIKIAQAVFNKYADIAKNYDATANSNYNLISAYDILAVICQEAGSNILKGLSNSVIMGDKLLKYPAFGIMQIRQPALSDTCKAFGYELTTADLKNSVETNIKVGAGYLQLCMKQAAKENSKDIKYLGYRKYNSGVSNAHDNNTVSKDYADSVAQYYNILKTLVRTTL